MCSFGGSHTDQLSIFSGQHMCSMTGMIVWKVHEFYLKALQKPRMLQQKVWENQEFGLGKKVAIL